ncbi:uncharacterized protein MYCFIDRAFT_78121 [Pseudocercospora fijiensis CIRAD86]|uniref:Uncharacterized protein n=1 Tax=Pseudocercospora fijiensis (strain CIRAD86) TaxID=383855 RepID=M2YRN2_PSEFD|nr:uncharacterized protein MYCFIDRAFT_78121 [Pseudocercospora fijiensis CIRAD86]EME80380.1 hypothetical protein MYCFIDRAFT_78121 [Pseudocercospora fijiensis CIRAD86]
MFAARLRDENAIHDQQTAAASKPLNAGVKGLAPKTPAKTPFKSNRNDENATQLGGKTGAKGGKLDRSAFVTPANPKARAPLGNKTTNAKAPKTPLLDVPNKDGHGQASNKPTSPRLRRSKIKVHETIESAEDVLAKDPEERETEYMAPREVPMKDDYEDFWPNELNLDVLKGTNLTRGWWGEYGPRKDEDDSELSDFGEKCRKLEEVQEKGKKAKSAAKPVSRTAAPPTIRAQNAASALGSKTTVPRFAAPTTAAKARQPISSSTTTAKKPTPSLSNPRFAAAKAASNTTLGYSKGRAVSASARRPLSDIHAKRQNTASKEPEKAITSLDELLGLKLETAEDDEDDDDPFAVPEVASEEEEEVFQLDSV